MAYYNVKKRYWRKTFKLIYKIKLSVNNNTGDFFMEKILITGATSGIADAVIKRIINKDYYIYITVHTLSQLNRVKKKYKNSNNIECFKLDITNKEDRLKLLNLDIDILICNASIGIGGSIATINIDKLKENYEVNLFSTIEIIQIILSKMIKNNNGKIIIISSLASLTPIKFIGSYCSTKASLSSISKVIRKEIKMISKNIKIKLIEPGMYNTGFNKVMFDNKYDNDNSIYKYKKNIILKQEKFILDFLQKKNLKSISKKIEKAIISKNQKFIYRAPFFQVLVAKLYCLFLE